VPSFYWAAGGTGGLESKVSPDLVRLAHERVPWFVAVLWITGAMKVFAALGALPDVRLLYLEGAGHNSYQDEPKL
jgi:hypothetical protein